MTSYELKFLIGTPLGVRGQFFQDFEVRQELTQLHGGTLLANRQRDWERR
jgi:hypothetical protein